MPLELFNTLGRKKEVFEPLRPPKVGMYCCGPTVYNYAHIGNLRAYVFEDLLKRVLLWNGFELTHVVNITDVGHLTSDADEGEDKLEAGARREGRSVWEIAAFYTEAFMEDIKALHILEPSIWCRATDHIKQQLDLVLCLQRKGYTYQTSDGIYFDTAKLDDYGKLTNLKADQLEAGRRIKVGEKRNPTDFALWKFSPSDAKRQMEWDSPWGKSFPGWHIECSAMASHYLGEQFDIHCGGIDHIPVHHSNEIAQAEACFGKKPWVKYWLHNEFLVMEEGKMAKSKGSFVRLQSLVEAGIEPLAYRYFLLTTHYRKQITFTWEAVRGAQRSLERLRNLVVDLKAHAKEGVEADAGAIAKFEQAINDDLNTAQALAMLWGVLRDDRLTPQVKWATIVRFDAVLGFGFAGWEIEEVEVPEQIRSLLDARERAREGKAFAEADRLRDEIRAAGFDILDTPKGQKIEKRKE